MDGPLGRTRLVSKPASVSRIGGDEFAIVLPGTEPAFGEAILSTLTGLLEINNQYYPDSELSFSTGMATSKPGDRLEQVVKRADMKILQEHGDADGWVLVAESPDADAAGKPTTNLSVMVYRAAVHGHCFADYVAREEIVQALVDEELVVVEVEIGVDAIFFEDIVADGDLREEVRLAPFDQLAVSVEQVEQLRLERRARTVGVEIGEKRIVGFLKHDRSVEPRAEPLRQRGFSRADRALDRDGAERQAGE